MEQNFSMRIISKIKFRIYDPILFKILENKKRCNKYSFEYLIKRSRTTPFTSTPFEIELKIYVNYVKNGNKI